MRVVEGTSLFKTEDPTRFVGFDIYTYIMKNRCVESSFALAKCLVSDFVSFLLTILASKTSTTSTCTEHMSLVLAVDAWT
jgi:hypothetical protein